MSNVTQTYWSLNSDTEKLTFTGLEPTIRTREMFENPPQGKLSCTVFQSRKHYVFHSTETINHKSSLPLSTNTLHSHQHRAYVIVPIAVFEQDD